METKIDRDRKIEKLIYVVGLLKRWYLIPSIAIVGRAITLEREQGAIEKSLILLPQYWKYEWLVGTIIISYFGGSNNIFAVFRCTNNIFADCMETILITRNINPNILCWSKSINA